MFNTKVVLLNDKAVLPKKETPGSAGYDIKITGIDKIVDDVIFFKTGVAVQAPEGHYFELAPRSSISKTPLMLANSIGKIDEDYRGEIIIPIRVMHSEQGTGAQNEIRPNGIVHFAGAKPPTIYSLAEKIVVEKPWLAQLILKQRLETEGEQVTTLDTTTRGECGFGSTDSKKKEKVDKKPSVKRIE